MLLFVGLALLILCSLVALAFVTLAFLVSIVMFLLIIVASFALGGALGLAIFGSQDAVLIGALCGAVLGFLAIAVAGSQREKRLGSATTDERPNQVGLSAKKYFTEARKRRDNRVAHAAETARDIKAGNDAARRKRRGF
jgi:hypothetical protein